MPRSVSNVPCSLIFRHSFCSKIDVRKNSVFMIAPRLWGVKERAGAAPSAHRDKHTPGTARQAVWPRTKPIRESGAASCRRESGAGSACRREGKAKIKKEPGRESGAASCRRELRPGSAWWWRRGELNPCPKTSPYVFLRAQFTVFALRQLPFAAHRQTGAPHR